MIDINSYREHHIEIFSIIRNTALEKLEQRIKDNDKQGSLTGIIILKIISLKEINTTFGFNESDTFLFKFFTRMRQVLLPDDGLYRVSEDEFLIILSKTINEGHVILAANKLNNPYNHSFSIGNNHITIKTAMGIAIYPTHAKSAEELLKKSSMALDTAINEGQNYHVWLSKDNESDKSNIIIETELRKAINENNFTVYYQPKLDIKNNTIIGVESLARWTSPTYGNIPPDFFIPITEKTGLIHELTVIIINTALREARDWNKIGITLSLSINLSTINLQDFTLIELIKRAINIWDTNPDHLIFEVTESAMMLNPELSLAILNKIKDMRVRCSIDDFGTGYSSLAYLKKLPVSELKIDKSFVFNMAHDKEDAIIARAIIELAHNFELSVTAEGVENDLTLKQLEDMNCEFAQGYYIARPMSNEEFKLWLKDTNWNIQKN